MNAYEAIGPSEDQKRVLIRYGINAAVYGDIPRSVIALFISGLIGGVEIRKKIIEKCGLAPGKKVFVQKYGQPLVEAVIESITPNFKVICRGFKEPIRPTEIEPIP